MPTAGGIATKRTKTGAVLFGDRVGLLTPSPEDVQEAENPGLTEPPSLEEDSIEPGHRVTL